MSLDYSLIIFDCDGVLVDSEAISNRILAEELRAIGADISDDEAFRLFKGGHLMDAFQYAADQINAPVPDNIEQNYRDKCKVAFANELKAIPGVHELLSKLKAPRCVASNGPIFKIASNLKLTGLNEFFGDNLFSAYQVQQWKPEPALFLYAAKIKGHAPKDCIVVEDSVHGVQAAKRAEMRVIGFAPEHDGADLKAAGAMVAHSMEEVQALLGL